MNGTGHSMNDHGAVFHGNQSEADQAGGNGWNPGSHGRLRAALSGAVLCLMLALGGVGYLLIAATPAAAQQSYRFSQVKVEGNQRVDAPTILSYAGLKRGAAVSAAELDAAYQRVVASGLFEKVEFVPAGGTLVIRVKEYPTINIVNIEGNKRIKDEDLLAVVQSRSRHVYSPAQAEADAAAITEAYRQQGRLAATVTPKIIRRSENRVDLVFEVVEGKVVEIERISFVGNRAYSDRRLRRVLGTKQAGLLRALIKSDTYIPDRIEFDKQVLRDFYLSRGYIDFRVLSVTSALTRRRDAFLITFKVHEGQRFRFGKITASSDLPGIDPEEYLKVSKMRSGKIYNPAVVDRAITRMERLALQKGLNFIRVEPRVMRNERDQTLDIEFVISKGPRVFVERIDIEGNATTLDRVIRRQFRTVEGDPFNPREIRDAAERIRALGFFKKTDVNARDGSAPDRVIIDVNVEEQPTGNLNFGASFSSDTGFGLTLGFSERNFLGRGQSINFKLNTASRDRSFLFSFTEPALLGRDLSFGISAAYVTSNRSNALYSTKITRFSPSLGFPVSENGRLQVRYEAKAAEVFDVDAGSSPILQADAARGREISSGIGYSYSYDSRKTGLNPNAGIVFRFSQDYAGLGGDNKYIRTTALLGGETRVLNEEVTLRAVLEGGAIASLSGETRITDRFFLNSGKLRGFSPNGLGPRDTTAANNDALGGNIYSVLRLEAEFPLGLPEEYGITGGAFLDTGSLWGLDDLHGTAVDDGFHLRSAIGFSLFWDTSIGPLRFNFSHVLKKQPYDEERNFEFTVSTTF